MRRTQRLVALGAAVMLSATAPSIADAAATRYKLRQCGTIDVRGETGPVRQAVTARGADGTFGCVALTILQPSDVSLPPP